MYKILLDLQKADLKQKQPFEKIKLVVLEFYSSIYDIRKSKGFYNQ